MEQEYEKVAGFKYSCKHSAIETDLQNLPWSQTFLWTAELIHILVVKWKTDLKARAFPEEYFRTSAKDTGDTLVLANGFSNP